MATALLLALAFAVACAEPKAPHIVYIVADDLGWNDIGYRGNATDVQTPNLDELAAAGVKLEQFYAQLVCSPSRAAILTGKFPHRLCRTVSLQRVRRTACRSRSVQWLSSSEMLATRRTLLAR